MKISTKAETCDLALHVILAFYAIFIANYTQSVICDWFFALIGCFGKTEKSNYNFKRIYGIHYMFMNLHMYVCTSIWCFVLLRPTKIIKRSQDKCVFLFVYLLINSKEMIFIIPDPPNNFFLENALKKTTEYFQISFFIGKYNPFG